MYDEPSPTPKQRDKWEVLKAQARALGLSLPDTEPTTKYMAIEAIGRLEQRIRDVARKEQRPPLVLRSVIKGQVRAFIDVAEHADDRELVKQLRDFVGLLGAVGIAPVLMDLPAGRPWERPAGTLEAGHHAHVNALGLHH